MPVVQAFKFRQAWGGGGALETVEWVWRRQNRCKSEIGDGIGGTKVRLVRLVENVFATSSIHALVKD